MEVLLVSLVLAVRSGLAFFGRRDVRALLIWGSRAVEEPELRLGSFPEVGFFLGYAHMTCAITSLSLSLLTAERNGVYRAWEKGVHQVTHPLFRGVVALYLPFYCIWILLDLG